MEIKQKNPEQCDTCKDKKTKTFCLHCSNYYFDNLSLLNNIIKTLDGFLNKIKGDIITYISELKNYISDSEKNGRINEFKEKIQLIYDDNFKELTKIKEIYNEIKNSISIKEKCENNINEKKQDKELEYTLELIYEIKDNKNEDKSEKEYKDDNSEKSEEIEEKC